MNSVIIESVARPCVPPGKYGGTVCTEARDEDIPHVLVASTMKDMKSHGRNGKGETFQNGQDKVSRKEFDIVINKS